MAEKKTGSSELRKAAKEMGKKGGPARAKKLTAKRRSEIASMGGKASVEKRKGRG